MQAKVPRSVLLIQVLSAPSLLYQSCLYDKCLKERKSDPLSIYESLISYLILLLRHWIPPCSTPNAALLLLNAVTVPLSFLRWGDKWY